MKIGDRVTAPATSFDRDGRGQKKWSKENFGAAWKSATVSGVVVCPDKEKGKWLVFWELDSTISPLSENELTKVILHSSVTVPKFSQTNFLIRSTSFMLFKVPTVTTTNTSATSSTIASTAPTSQKCKVCDSSVSTLNYCLKCKDPVHPFCGHCVVSEDGDALETSSSPH